MNSTDGQQPLGLAEVVAETIRQWRAENPTATTVPRSIRRQISQAVRTDTRTHQLDAAITRNQVELAILHHQKDVLAHQYQGDSSADEWGRQQQRLHESAVKLENWIHQLPHLSKTERGQALRGLMQAHTAVDLNPGPGLVALKARAAEHFSAVRLGLVKVTRAMRSMAFRVAAWQADQREMEAQRPEGPQAWLTPAQSSALADLTTAARRWQAGAEQAQAAKESGTDLATLITNFNDALTFTRQIGISPERINQELVAAHGNQGGDQHRQGMWSKIQAAARGPLTPPTAAAAGTQQFAFGAAPATQAPSLAPVARRIR